MKFFPSRSFFLLVVSGLAIVALPLIIVLISAEVLMGQLAQQSAESVYTTVTGSQLSQELFEAILNQERRYRQYLVLGDAKLYDEVTHLHKEIQVILASMENLNQRPETMAMVTQLREEEDKLFATLPAQIDRTNPAGTAIVLKFVDLSELSKKIVQATNNRIYEESSTMRQKTALAKSILVWQAVAFIPVTIVLVVCFAHLITRPIKEIEGSISRLGSGDFNTPISVSGPQDLVSLGERLDWLREKLSVFEKEKTRFAAHVSHELKTPLASLREGAEILADEIAGPLNEQQTEITSILQKNALHLQELIENLLNYTMAQAHRTHLNIEDFFLEDVILESIENHKPTILKNEFTIVTDVSGIRLWADRAKLLTVFDNLMSNALKYTPKAGQVSISAVSHGQEIQLDFSDSGPGIAPEEKESVFTPFFQGRTPNLSHIKGTGLGLAIVSDIISAHGGRIELIEKSTQSGTHFRIFFPKDCTKGLA